MLKKLFFLLVIVAILGTMAGFAFWNVQDAMTSDFHGCTPNRIYLIGEQSGWEYHAVCRKTPGDNIHDSYQITETGAIYGPSFHDDQLINIIFEQRNLQLSQKGK